MQDNKANTTSTHRPAIDAWKRHIENDSVNLLKDNIVCDVLEDQQDSRKSAISQNVHNVETHAIIPIRKISVEYELKLVWTAWDFVRRDLSFEEANIFLLVWTVNFGSFQRLQTFLHLCWEDIFVFETDCPFQNISAKELSSLAGNPSPSQCFISCFSLTI